jgi:hypothetical protein
MDSKKIAEILKKGLDSLSESIKKSLFNNDRVVTGKTAKSLRVDVKSTATQVKGALYGSSVLEQLEFGRGKTKNGGSNRAWEDDLRLWMKFRNIPQSAFYPIWRKINKEGYKGTAGLVSNPVDDFKKGVAKDIKSIILKDFKSNGFNSNQ